MLSDPDIKLEIISTIQSSGAKNNLSMEDNDDAKTTNRDSDFKQVLAKIEEVVRHS